MKKIVAISLFLTSCASVYADSLNLISCGLGAPGIDEPQLIGLGISPDGRYVCGPIESGAGVFVADWQTGEVKWKVGGESGSELRHVDNNGIAIGYIEDSGVLYSFNSGEESLITPPDGSRFVLGESLSNDGSVLVGSLSAQSFDTEAAYCNVKDGDEWIKLPFPTDEELGGFSDKMRKISSAKCVSGDGKIILGCLGSFTCPVIWKMNESGVYEVDVFPVRYVKLSEEDIPNDDKMLYSISGTYLSLSNNGKYVSMLGLIRDEYGERNVPVVYNTEDKTIKVYSEEQIIDEYGFGLYPIAISDDGTFIGTMGQPFYASSGSFIMKAGQTVAESFIDAFPAFAEKFSETDLVGFNIPTGISADSQYILGYTFYSDDYYSEEGAAYWLSYVISTDLVNSVDRISSESLNGNEMIYSIDGRKLNRMADGLNIVRGSDGKVRKILK